MAIGSTNIELLIECENEEFAEIVIKGLEPENKILDSNTKITMVKTGKIVKIIIISISKLSSVRYTIDDILSTISTIEKVYKTKFKVDKLKE